MATTIVSSPDLPPTSGPFAHATIADGTRTLFISGQVALDAQGTLVGANDPEEQARQCLRNLDAILKAAGAPREAVTRIGVYLTDMNHRAAVARARSEFFGDHTPAATLVGIASLVHPDLVVEIEAVAVLE